MSRILPRGLNHSNDNRTVAAESKGEIRRAQDTVLPFRISSRVLLSSIFTSISVFLLGVVSGIIMPADGAPDIVNVYLGEVNS
jgi:hypothetical protein